MKKMLFLILSPLLILALVESTFIIASITGIEESRAADSLLEQASLEAHQLEVNIAAEEAIIQTLSLGIGTIFSDEDYFENGDLYLQELRNRIAPLILKTAQSIDSCKGVYFMFAPSYGSVPSQVWFNDKNLDGDFKQIVEFPSPDDFDRDNPYMDYYYTPIETESPYWSPPYIDIDTSVPMFSYCVPVKAGESIIGIAGFDLSMNNLVERFSSIRFLDTGYPFLLNDNNKIIYHPDFPMNTDITSLQELQFLREEMDSGYQKNSFTYTYRNEKKQMAYYRLTNEWLLGYTAFEKEIFKPVRKLQFQLLMISLFVILLTACVAILSAQLLTRPIVRLTEEVKRTTGNISSILNDPVLLRRKDELGDLAREFRVLQKAFTETLRRIIDTNIDLEQMASLGSHVGIFTHEIKTPIGIIVTSISFAEERLNELEEKIENNGLTRNDLGRYIQDVKKSLSLSERNISHAKTLIDSFKDNADSKRNNTRKKINPREMIDEISTGILLQHKDKNIQILNNTSDCLYLVCHCGYMTQIITNLISNSILHGFHDRDDGIIEITCREEEKGIFFDYSDNGKGIPSDYEERIFEPYFTTAGDRGGTGLGLHIINTILTRYLEGSIEYIKKEEAGVLFRIFIPHSSDGAVES